MIFFSALRFLFFKFLLFLLQSLFCLFFLFHFLYRINRRTIIIGYKKSIWFLWPRSFVHVELINCKMVWILDFDSKWLFLTYSSGFSYCIWMISADRMLMWNPARFALSTLSTLLAFRIVRTDFFMNLAFLKSKFFDLRFKFTLHVFTLLL